MGSKWTSYKICGFFEHIQDFSESENSFLRNKNRQNRQKTPIFNWFGCFGVS